MKYPRMFPLVILGLLEEIVPILGHISSVHIKQIEDFDNTILNAFTVFYMTNVKTRIRCAGKCSIDGNCVSVFYNSRENWCQGHSVLFTSISGGSSSIDTKYYRVFEDWCPMPDYINHRGLELCYNFYLSTVVNPSNHQTAMDFCRQKGEEFLTHLTQAQIDHIVEQRSTTDFRSVWIDGTDQATEGTWYYSNGDLMTLLDWAPGEPDNNNPDHHFIILRLSSKDGSSGFSDAGDKGMKYLGMLPLVILGLLEEIVPNSGHISVHMKQIEVFDNTILNAFTVFYMTNVKTRIRCAGKCSIDGNCVSVFYNSREKWCQGHSVLFTSISGGSSSIDTKYYRVFEDWCPMPDYINHRGLELCYNFYLSTVVNPSNHQTAMEYCQHKGEAFLTHLTQAQIDHIVEQRSTTDFRSVWIDGTDQGTEGTWYYSNGDLMTLLDWAPGEPDNNNPDHYFIILRLSSKDGSSGFSDAGNKGRNFVCSRKKTVIV